MYMHTVHSLLSNASPCAGTLIVSIFIEDGTLPTLLFSAGGGEDMSMESIDKSALTTSNTVESSPELILEVVSKPKEFEEVLLAVVVVDADVVIGVWSCVEGKGVMLGRGIVGWELFEARE